jgi:hypothetical protein
MTFRAGWSVRPEEKICLGWGVEHLNPAELLDKIPLQHGA